MARTRVKICGITNLEDALSAVEAGADALGFVFYEKSPRYVSPEKAAEIIRQLPPFIVSVGLFVDANVSFVESVINHVRLSLLQFHGNETESFCQQFALPYIKAIRVKQGQDILQAVQSYHSARGLLLDAYVEGVPGGTGKTFDWSIIPEKHRNQIILAGGLDAENVARAIKHIHPYAVDVSGGVEAFKGKKDPMLISKFVSEVIRE
ncbi:MAG: phosphoribosylanthranilate isomerase [Hahellaceae bacterium]|jgi:phosphoribosylanthranilate isomerase|nr:phosphoribosylanthranilate isomerase [Hahellaceae bacterium]MCP5212896.1 phosphoribosylanthranilate isomerase [Hahellaceae bacterium]